jgi:hypothetical protein
MDYNNANMLIVYDDPSIRRMSGDLPDTPLDWQDAVPITSSQPAIALRRPQEACPGVLWRLMAASMRRDDETDQPIQPMSPFAAAIARRIESPESQPYARLSIVS